MAKLSAKLRSVERGHAHWCPGCMGMHVIPDTWERTGDYERPSFSPSVKITYNGRDAGELRDAGHRAPAACCHYFLTLGRLLFCADSTHALAGHTVDLPDIPPAFEDLS